MKKERKEIIRKEYKDIYVANDGKEFASEEECKKYEQTAEGVINSAFARLSVGNKVLNVSEDWYIFGCEEDLGCVSITDEHDLHDFNMFLQYHDARPVGKLWSDGVRGTIQFGPEAIGTIQVVGVDSIENFYAYGSIEELKAYLYGHADELIKRLTEKKEEEK